MHVCTHDMYCRLVHADVSATVWYKHSSKCGHEAGYMHQVTRVLWAAGAYTLLCVGVVAACVQSLQPFRYLWFLTRCLRSLLVRVANAVFLVTL